MVSIDEMKALLDDIADGFPEDLFRGLNGGILLLPELKRNSVHQDLFILGEYTRGGSLGRFITIYYGSFCQVFGYLDAEALRIELTHTLKHEFTHHVESLAGERGLEREDEKFLREFLQSKNK